MLYALTAIGVFSVTTVMKAMTDRDRPENPKESDDEKYRRALRFFNLRGRESNKSMPSGDTAQSAACAAFICLYLPGIFALFGGELFRMRLIATVAMARIFYHCHFIGDTMVGALVGTTIAYALKWMNVQVLADMIAQYMSEV